MRMNQATELHCMPTTWLSCLGLAQETACLKLQDCLAEIAHLLVQDSQLDLNLPSLRGGARRIGELLKFSGLQKVLHNPGLLKIGITWIACKIWLHVSAAIQESAPDSASTRRELDTVILAQAACSCFWNSHHQLPCCCAATLKPSMLSIIMLPHLKPCHAFQSLCNVPRDPNFLTEDVRPETLWPQMPCPKLKSAFSSLARQKHLLHSSEHCCAEPSDCRE